eukprot:10850927-Karenia_brevis.AAC.1
MPCPASLLLLEKGSRVSSSSAVGGACLLGSSASMSNSCECFSDSADFFHPVLFLQHAYLFSSSPFLFFGPRSSSVPLAMLLQSQHQDDFCACKDKPKFLQPKLAYMYSLPPDFALLCIHTIR